MTPLEAQAKLDSAIEEYGTRATLTSASSVVVDEREGTVTKSDSTRALLLFEDDVEVTAVDGVYVAETTAMVRLDEEVQVGDTIAFGGWTFRVGATLDTEIQGVGLGQKLFLRSI